MPVLSDFVEYRKADFTSPVNGADLTITVVDSSMPNGRTYKRCFLLLLENKHLYM